MDMDLDDAVLLLAGAILGGIAVYVLFFRSQPYSQVQTYVKPEAKVYKPVAVNKEVWEWTDWKGRPRKITVSREVKQLG